MSTGIRRLVQWSVGGALFCALAVAQMDWELEHGRSYLYGMGDFVALTAFVFYASFLFVFAFGIGLLCLWRLPWRGGAGTDRPVPEAGVAPEGDWHASVALVLLCGTCLALAFGTISAVVDADLKGFADLRGQDVWRVTVQSEPAFLAICWAESLTYRACSKSRLRTLYWLGSLVVALLCAGSYLLTTMVLAEGIRGGDLDRIHDNVSGMLHAGWWYFSVRYGLMIIGWSHAQWRLARLSAPRLFG